MKRNATHPAKPVRALGGTKKSRASSKAIKPDATDTLVAASALALGLPLDPAWQAAVRSNFELILRHAALVDAFPLPDDAEPAPVFHA